MVKLMKINLSDYRKVFLGKCLGIGIKKEENDDHAFIHILMGGEDRWETIDGALAFSSAWANQLVQQMIAANLWLCENCEPDTRQEDPRGWRFKK